MRTLSFFKAASALLALTLSFASCEPKHFMTDADYREQVQADLQARLSQSEGLKNCFAVDYENRRLSENTGYVNDIYLTTEEIEALEFLYAYMPLGDVTDYSTDYYLQNVRASFKAREEMGWNVPEREFRHFVLPIRANNESLDTSRVAFYRELKPRIEGMSMKDAILEVNHWCHEKLTYKPSDARTLSPLASMRSTLGRCGEESTFGVAALRSVGIPARQVYTPRWAHTDDNHAWVEAWADGEWYFLGACEPEPVLNLGWFNDPASRGLLMHTRVFGRYDGPEETVMTGTNYVEINLIDNYATTARVDFQVVDEAGNPVDSAKVDFKIYNYAEFYPALSKYTDAEGKTFLTAGKGDMLAWASKDGLYGYSKVSFGTDSTVVITLSKNHSAEPLSLMIVPPPSGALLPEVTPEQRAENDRRFAQEDEIRKSYMSTFMVSDGTVKGDMLALAAGNHDVIKAFLDAHPDERALELLKSLSQKDKIDVTREILEDSYNAKESILCPRIENEFLSPYKSYFIERFGTELNKEELSEPANLIKWVQDNIKVVEDPKAYNMAMSPIGVYKIKMADVRSRNLFFVALARTLGIDARKDPVTGKIQYKENGSWVDVDFEATEQTVAPTGRVVLNYKPVKTLRNPGYYSHFTISKIEADGRTKLLTFDEGQVDMGGGVSWENVFKKGTSLDVGDYILVSGNRLSDGSVPVTMQQFSVEEGKTTSLDLRITVPEGRLSVIGSFDAETRFKTNPAAEPVSILSVTGRGFYVVGFLEPRKEPSVHAINDIIAAKAELEEWGRTILLLTTEEGLEWLKEYSDRLPSNVRFGITPAKVADGRRLPYFILADTFNRIFFTTEGYTIGLGDQLVTAISSL